MSFPLAEIDRRVANIFRIGTVYALDAANALVQVDLGDLVTDWLPWGTGRAGSTRKWSAPSVGEQVMVFSPSGELAAGIVGPSIFQDAHPAPSNNPNVDNVTFADGSSVNYDAGSNTLTVNVSGAGNIVVNCKVATVKADTSVTLDTPMVHATKNMQVDGNLGVTGAMAVQGQGTSGAVSTFAGSIQVTNGDVTADAYSLKGHHHTAQGASAPTTSAQP